MLGWRIAISAVLIPAFAILFYIDQRAGEAAPVLLGLSLLLALRASWELVALLRVRAFEPSYPQTALLSCTLIAASWSVHVATLPSAFQNVGALGLIGLVYAAAVLWLLASNAARYRAPGRQMETLGAELLIVSYVGVLLAVTAQLRWVAGYRAGYLVLGSLIIVAKSGDIGAYALGRLFGRRKMSPLLSPGKTWAGALGSVLASSVAGWAWLKWAPPLFDASWSARPPLWSIVYGSAIGVSGIVGDLCESLIKRDLGKKDAAALMPGFGGLLDLLDSVVFAGPVAYVLWLVLPLAP